MFSAAKVFSLKIALFYFFVSFKYSYFLSLCAVLVAYITEKVHDLTETHISRVDFCLFVIADLCFRCCCYYVVFRC